MICLARNWKKYQITIVNVATEVIMFQSTSTYVIIIMQYDAKWLQFVGVLHNKTVTYISSLCSYDFLIYATYRMRNYRQYKHAKKILEIYCLYLGTWNLVVGLWTYIFVQELLLLDYQIVKHFGGKFLRGYDLKI
jgi:hypothetical protein